MYILWINYLPHLSPFYSAFIGSESCPCLQCQWMKNKNVLLLSPVLLLLDSAQRENKAIWMFCLGHLVFAMGKGFTGGMLRASVEPRHKNRLGLPASIRDLAYQGLGDGSGQLQTWGAKISFMPFCSCSCQSMVKWRSLHRLLSPERHFPMLRQSWCREIPLEQ